MGSEKSVTPTRGVPIMLDKQRYLRFSLGTMKKLRKEFGDQMAGGIPPDRIGEFLWFGLKHEDSALTVEDVEELIDLEHLPQVMEAVSIATGTRLTDLDKLVEEEKTAKAVQAAVDADPSPPPVPDIAPEKLSSTGSDKPRTPKQRKRSGTK